MVSRRTGPPKNTLSPDNFLSVGRLRITPTVWASGVCVTSTTVSRKLGSVRPGLATSSTPFGRSAGCAAASIVPIGLFESTMLRELELTGTSSFACA